MLAYAEKFMIFSLINASLMGCGRDAVAPHASAAIVGETGPLSPNLQKKLVCDHPGFCLSHDDGFRFYGGFRKDDQEIQFQIAYNKNENLDSVNTNDYCARLMTETARRLTGTGDCGVDWLPPREPYYGENLTAYQTLAKEFLQYIEKTTPPSNREHQWFTLALFLERFQSLPLCSPADPETDKVITANQLKLDELVRIKAENAVKQANRALAHSARYPSARAARLELANTQVAQQSSAVFMQAHQSMQPLGWWGRHIMHDLDTIDLAELHSNPACEYRQHLGIWAQKFSFAGIEGGSEHSATWTWVESRPIDSAPDVPWERVGDFRSKNHGAEPGEGNMRLNLVCGPEILGITKGYYVIFGECDGAWLQDHVCNDDTAYQVRSAYGVWTDTNDLGEGVCRGRRRWNPPNCSLPW